MNESEPVENTSSNCTRGQRVLMGIDMNKHPNQKAYYILFHENSLAEIYREIFAPEFVTRKQA